MPSTLEQKAGSSSDGQDNEAAPRQSEDDPANGSPKQENWLVGKAKKMWAKTGITWNVYKLMFKGALAPTIAISAYQSTAWAETYTTLGYLVGVVCVLSLVIQPRAKFLQTMLVQLLMASLGAAFALLASYCAVQARIHTTGFTGPGKGGAGTSGLASKGAETAEYNSSASAVCGVWLFFLIYTISVIRARMPQYTIPCIMWAIFANVSMAYAPQFSTMGQAEAFVKSLYVAFLTGMAIALGVSLLIFPLTSRSMLFKDMQAFLDGLRSALQANTTYMKSLEDVDMFAAQRTNTAGEKPRRSPEAEAFLAKMRAVSALQAKIVTNLPLAKREVAIGKLGPDDLQQLYGLFREIMIPAIGLSCVPDIFERTSLAREWDRSKSFASANLADATNEAERARIQSINEWHELVRLLKEPFESITNVIDEALQHVSITLQLTKQPKRPAEADDREKSGDTPCPGDKDFAEYLRRRAEEFQKSKEIMLHGWCHLHGIDLPEGYFQDPNRKDFEVPKWMNEGYASLENNRLRRQLMVMLYVEFLLYYIGRRAHDIILFADNLRDSGKLSKNRLVVPGVKRLRKWVYSMFEGQDVHHEEYDYEMTVQLGTAYKRKKDIEHLPPATPWEHFSNQFRKIAHFFASPASTFGFRCATATMSIAIVSFLHVSQVFATKERLFWAQIMTSIGMSPSAGQSLRTLTLRIVGTFIAMIFCYIDYYIVDGQTAGIIVFYFVFLHLGVWTILHFPAIAPVGIIGQITITLVIGYEMQVRKIGIATAVSNGQRYWPIYDLAPIRLLTVISGLFVAWVFSVFPYPVTEHSQLRQSLGSTLYLLANYYSLMHETVQTRLKGAEGDLALKSSPGRRLAKVRHKIYAKCNVVLAGLRSRSGFLKFDIPIGGKFPKEQYDDIIERCQNILNFIALISVASAAFGSLDPHNKQNPNYAWLLDLRKVMNEANLTSQTVTSLLSLLSSSVTNGNALPPYLRTPEPYALAERLENIDRDILSVKHIAEPGYASFGVIQLGTQCLVDELKSLLAGVKELVGELDFSYHIVSTAAPTANNSQETLTYSKSRSGDGDRNKQE